MAPDILPERRIAHDLNRGTMTSATSSATDSGENPVPSPALEKPGSGSGTGASNLEIAVALAIAVIGAVAVGYAAREWWFHSDAWDFLTGRSLADPITLLEGHAGHWQTPTVLAYLSIGALVGMDFWPAYYLPRVFGYAAWAVWFWSVLRRRGTHPLPALAFLSLALILVVSDWQDLSTMGNLIVLSVSLKVALMATEEPENRHRFRLLLLGLLVLAVASSSLGVALLVGSGMATVLSRSRLKLWWPSLAGATMVYGTWYLLFREAVPPGGSIVASVVSVPRWSFVIVEHAFTELLRIGVLATGATIILVGAIVWLVIKRKLDGFDAVLLSMLVVYLAMVIIYRVAPGSALPTATRYSHNVLFLLGAVLVPRIAPIRLRYQSIAIAMIVVLLLPFHWSMLNTRINFWERRAQASREVVESAAYLMNDGEPWLPNSPIDPPRAGMLTTTRLEELTTDGWAPPLSPDTPSVERARSHLRFSIRPSGNASSPLPTLIEGTTTDGQCVSPSPSGLISLMITGPVTLQVVTPGPALTITWEDSFGTGRRDVTPRGRFAEGLFVTTIDPESPAIMTFMWTDQGEAIICSG